MRGFPFAVVFAVAAAGPGASAGEVWLGGPYDPSAEGPVRYALEVRGTAAVSALGPGVDLGEPRTSLRQSFSEGRLVREAWSRFEILRFPLEAGDPWPDASLVVRSEGAGAPAATLLLPAPERQRVERLPVTAATARWVGLPDIVWVRRPIAAEIRLSFDARFFRDRIAPFLRRPGGAGGGGLPPWELRGGALDPGPHLALLPRRTEAGTAAPTVAWNGDRWPLAPAADPAERGRVAWRLPVTVFPLRSGPVFLPPSLLLLELPSRRGVDLLGRPVPLGRTVAAVEVPGHAFEAAALPEPAPPGFCGAVGRIGVTGALVEELPQEGAVRWLFDLTGEGTLGWTDPDPQTLGRSLPGVTSIASARTDEGIRLTVEFAGAPPGPPRLPGVVWFDPDSGRYVPLAGLSPDARAERPERSWWGRVGRGRSEAARRGALESPWFWLPFAVAAAFLWRARWELHSWSVRLRARRRLRRCLRERRRAAEVRDALVGWFRAHYGLGRAQVLDPHLAARLLRLGADDEAARAAGRLFDRLARVEFGGEAAAPAPEEVDRIVGSLAPPKTRPSLALAAGALLLLAVCALAVAHTIRRPGGAEPPHPAAAAVARAFEEGRFEAAAELLEAVASQRPRDGALLRDLGVAWAHAGRPIRALAALGAARDLLGPSGDLEERIGRLLHRLGRGADSATPSGWRPDRTAWGWLAVVFFAAAVLLFPAGRPVGPGRAALALAAGAAALVALLGPMGGAAARALVAREGAPLRAGAHPSAGAVALLPAGAEVEVLAASDRMAKVAWRGRTGFVTVEEIVPVWKPYVAPSGRGPSLR